MWQWLATFEAFSRALGMDGYHPTSLSACLQPPELQKDKSSLVTPCPVVFVCFFFLLLYPLFSLRVTAMKLLGLFINFTCQPFPHFLVTDFTAPCARSALLHPQEMVSWRNTIGRPCVRGSSGRGEPPHDCGTCFPMEW